MTSYLNASDGETIEFGTPKYGIKNYPYDYHQQWFLIVPEGRQVQLEFESFELEESKDCKNDYVEIREAYFSFTDEDPQIIAGEFGEILTGHVCGTSKPSTMQSKGNMVWVSFKSDDNTTTVYKGFKATFTAGKCKRNAAHENLNSQEMKRKRVNPLYGPYSQNPSQEKLFLEWYPVLRR